MAAVAVFVGWKMCAADNVSIATWRSLIATCLRQISANFLLKPLSVLTVSRKTWQEPNLSTGVA